MGDDNIQLTVIYSMIYLLPSGKKKTYTLNLVKMLTSVCYLLKADEISHVIAELEKSIARYKEEYAALISQAQAIKADLAAVEAKVRR